jgi:hypothetical protein
MERQLEQVRRETTLYRRSAWLRAWVDARDDHTPTGRRRTRRATALANRLHERAGQLSTARAIDALWSVLEGLAPENPAYTHVQRAHTTLTNPMPPPGPAEASVTAWPPRVAALRAIEAALSADDLPAEIRSELKTARAAVMRPMRLAIPIKEVRAHVEHQQARIEPAYQRERAEHGPDWPTIWSRRTWLYWLEKKALRRAERAGLGAVLATAADESLLEQLGLLGEQLRWQGRIDQVPRDVTADAVEPYWTSSTSISASAEGARGRPRSKTDETELAGGIREKRERERAELRRLAEPGNEAERREFARRQSEGVVGFRWHPGQAVRRNPDPPPARPGDELERRLWKLDRTLGCSRPVAGLEEVNEHAVLAACHFAAWRVLQSAEWYDPHRLEQARDEIETARSAYESAEVAVDGVGEELASIARALQEIEP